MGVDLSQLGPMPAEIQRALAQAEAEAQQGNMPIVLESKHNMANYGLALSEDNPILTFDIPHSPGVERKLFPFSWEAFDKYLAALQKFREEHGPLAE